MQQHMVMILNHLTCLSERVPGLQHMPVLVDLQLTVRAYSCWQLQKHAFDFQCMPRPNNWLHPASAIALC